MNSFKKIFPHVLFWVLLWLLFIFVDKGEGNLIDVAITELIHIFFYVSLIYINLYFLIPNFLSSEKFWKYTIYLIGIVLFGTFLKVMVLYLRFYNDPIIRFNLLQNQTWIFVSNFLITGISTVYKIISDWVKHQREKRELERQSMQSELKFLKTQINPHFLFNTLNNLYALTLKKSDLAPDIVLKLSDMMRYMLYECNERVVPLHKEITYMQNYMDLEKLRFGKSDNIELTIEGEISEQLIAPLILIPFIENAFKHGLKSAIEQDAYCFVHLNLNKDQLEFSVVNSKPNIVIQHKDKIGGIGLVNVQRRLNLLYPDQYKLKITNRLNEYNVNLKLKLINA